MTTIQFNKAFWEGLDKYAELYTLVFLLFLCISRHTNPR